MDIKISQTILEEHASHEIVNPPRRGSSSESDELANICLMAKHKKKKKNVSHSKYEPIDKMSYYELHVSFENLHGEAKKDFKRLASTKE